MVKYLALLAVALATLVVVDAAQARGRRGGCHGGSCYAGGGCANGSCYVGGDYKTAAAVESGAPVVSEAPPAANATVAVQPAPRYSNNVRRGWLFARRR